MRTFPAKTPRPALLGGLMLCGTLMALQAGAAPAGEAALRPAAPTMYRVTNLGMAYVSAASLNNKNQVAFNTLPDIHDPQPNHAYFVDGAIVRELGGLGGGFTSVTGLNDAGQVTGVSEIPSGHGHVYIWSARHGLHDIGALPGADIVVSDPAINERGDIIATGAGNDAGAPYARAYLWSRAHGLEDLGSLVGATGSAYGRALNDSALVAGSSDSLSLNSHAFAWTRSGGMLDIDILGSSLSDPVAVSADGLVAGNAWLPPGNVNHVFVWTRKHGMHDLGAAGGVGTWMFGMSANGQIAAATVFDPYRLRALTWSPAAGLTRLGTLGGTESYANTANTKGQVVGAARTNSDVFHAFVWSAREGMVDLNRRLLHAPAGLELYAGVAINDNGAILASANTGTVLLTPCGCATTGHATGPIAGPELVQVGTPFDASVGFVTDATPGTAPAQYKVRWSWGDHDAEQVGDARLQGGTGSAGATHVYAAPGIYNVTANVVDGAGQQSRVSRTVTVYDPAQGIVGGSGTLLAQGRGAAATGLPPGRASFAFAAPAAGTKQGQLSFAARGLRFTSSDLAAVSTAGPASRFAGSGTLNGRGGYQVALETSAGAAGSVNAGRVGIKIWHADQKTGAEVVDVDQRIDRGGAIVEGAVVMRR